MRRLLLSILFFGLACQGAQASEATLLFKREFIERFLETFYNGQQFAFGGLNCKGDPWVDKRAACDSADRVVSVQIRNTTHQDGDKIENWNAVAQLVSVPPIRSYGNWAVDSRSDMDTIIDSLSDWIKSKPNMKFDAPCFQPKGATRRLAFNVISLTGEHAYIVVALTDSEFGPMLVFAITRGEGFCTAALG